MYFGLFDPFNDFTSFSRPELHEKSAMGHLNMISQVNKTVIVFVVLRSFFFHVKLFCVYI